MSSSVIIVHLIGPGSSQDDSGFSQVDSGIRQEDSGFSQVDSGFSQVDSGFREKRTGFSEKENRIQPVGNPQSCRQKAGTRGYSWCCFTVGNMH